MPFASQVLSATHLGGGNFETALPTAGGTPQFHQLHLSLK